ncbi:MAG: haloacid dehalogenase-like hydrolase [Candidatus Methanomethylophilaceae archaeon]|nr:haloacid dehalogenase-like hydrolase [Candidatus Methanomethylophilaceae archaeon]
MTDIFMPGEGALDAWTEGSKPVKALLDFVSRVTDPASESFVPEEDRVAVFDMDGTILSENHPGDLEWAMYLRRVMHDPGYVPDERQKALAEEMIEVIRTGIKKPGFTERKNECNAAAFRGMTLDGYEAYVDRYLEEESGTYRNARRRDLFYAPMLQLMDLLSRKGFSVFVCSATETMNVRRTIAGLPGVTPGSAIATEYELEATRQNGADSIGYVMGPDEDLVYSGRTITVASGMNKVARIVQVVGKRPILSFGNGSGDYSMLTYVSENPHHDSMSFILCADDPVRDYGNAERTVQFKEYAEKMGWGVISMKDDFKRIYAEGIVPRFKDVFDFFAGDRSDS